MEITHDALQQAVDWIAQADALLVTAGAGMGIDSGLPDFRGPGGFWRAYPALQERRMGFENIATQAAFAATPRVAWGFYGHRLQLYRNTVPHRGFGILRAFADRMPGGAFVYTSNVDGQFQKAGFDVTRITECHGSIHYLQCQSACTSRIWSATALIVDVDSETGLWRGDLPACQECGGLARPNILLFEDWAWQQARTDMQQHRIATWLVNAGRVVIIELGAGTAIPSVRRFGERQKGPLIRINPGAPAISRANAIGVAAGALETLTALHQALILRDAPSQ